MKRILVTGSRKWDRTYDIYHTLYWAGKGHDKVTLFHGGAEGADSIAHDYAAMEGWDVEIFYPDYAQYGVSAPHVRNQQMVDQQPDEVHAFIRDMSSGTLSTVIKALQKRLKVYLHYYEDEV